MIPPRRARPAPQEQFKEFQASVLFCGRCQVAQRVRERLLLVLPDGELHEYLCVACGEQVGKRKISGGQPLVIAS